MYKLEDLKSHSFSQVPCWPMHEFGDRPVVHVICSTQSHLTVLPNCVTHHLLFGEYVFFLSVFDSFIHFFPA